MGRSRHKKAKGKSTFRKVLAGTKADDHLLRGVYHQVVAHVEKTHRGSHKTGKISSHQRLIARQFRDQINAINSDRKDKLEDKRRSEYENLEDRDKYRHINSRKNIESQRKK